MGCISNGRSLCPCPPQAEGSAAGTRRQRQEAEEPVFPAVGDAAVHLKPFPARASPATRNRRNGRPCPSPATLPSSALPTDRRAPDIPQETVIPAGLTRRVPHPPQKEQTTHALFTAVMAAASVASQTGKRATDVYSNVPQTFGVFDKALPIGPFRVKQNSPLWGTWGKQAKEMDLKGGHQPDKLSDEELSAAHRAPPPPPPSV